MFTGLVEEKGRVAALTEAVDSAQLTVECARVIEGVSQGNSIAVNGVCLTVAEYTSTSFVADMMAETLNRTTLGTLASGTEVNLERAVTPTTRLGGHIMQGHVDGVGEIIQVAPGDRWTTLTVRLPQELAVYVAEKGSIAINGVSLTVVAVSSVNPIDGTEPWFGVSLIPTTLDETTLGSASVGDRVNIEVDVIAKYTQRLMGEPR